MIAPGQISSVSANTHTDSTELIIQCFRMWWLYMSLIAETPRHSRETQKGSCRQFFFILMKTFVVFVVIWKIVSNFRTVFVCTIKKIARIAGEVGTNDKKVLIQLNGPPSGYKGTWKFLNAILFSMYMVILIFPTLEI